MDISFVVTEQEAQLMVTGLGKLPAEASMNLIMKLQNQYTAQKEGSKSEVQQD